MAGTPSLALLPVPQEPQGAASSPVACCAPPQVTISVAASLGCNLAEYEIQYSRLPVQSRPDQALDGLAGACAVCCCPVVLRVELVAQVLCHSGRQVAVQACRKCNPLFIHCTGSVRTSGSHSAPAALRRGNAIQLSNKPPRTAS